MSAVANQQLGADLALEPFASSYNRSERLPYAIGLVPDECEIQTTTTDDINAWKTEPTRSYIVRETEATKAEWFRVRCGGHVTMKVDVVDEEHLR